MHNWFNILEYLYKIIEKYVFMGNHKLQDIIYNEDEF